MKDRSFYRGKECESFILVYNEKRILEMKWTTKYVWYFEIRPLKKHATAHYDQDQWPDQSHNHHRNDLTIDGFFRSHLTSAWKWPIDYTCNIFLTFLKLKFELTICKVRFYQINWKFELIPIFSEKQNANSLSWTFSDRLVNKVCGRIVLFVYLFGIGTILCFIFSS